MIEAPRRTGSLDVSARVHSALRKLRARHAVSSPATLELQRVHEVEAAFGAHLPDDVLALYAAKLPLFTEQYRMTISAVVGHTGTLRENRVRGDFIGIGAVQPREILCAQKNTPADQLVIVDLDDRRERPVELTAWLEQELGRSGADGALGLEPFEPCLIATQPESTMAGRRVRHKVFGEGKALKEMGDGPSRKVKVDFPGRGLKLLQARFLEFLDD